MPIVNAKSKPPWEWLISLELKPRRDFENFRDLDETETWILELYETETRLNFDNFNFYDMELRVFYLELSAFKAEARNSGAGII